MVKPRRKPMPTRVVNGAQIHYEETGSGPETIVFSHGLLMSGEMFSEQVEALSRRYRCISYDHRGQARSEVTKSGYDMDSLTADAEVLIRDLGAAPCHFAGLSMGGFIGMRLAIHRPELLKSLILMDTSADPEPEQNKGPYRRMAFIGRWFGFRPVIKPLMKIMFGQTFLNDPAAQTIRAHWTNHLMGLDKVGTSRAAHGVIDRDGVYDLLGRIETPTLILVGDEDVATVPAKAERMQQAIRGSRLVVIPGAGHSASIEQPALVTRALEDFLHQNL
jgi:pimeloyl-ACP methyl ester carboxylesterase